MVVKQVDVDFLPLFVSVLDVVPTTPSRWL